MIFLGGTSGRNDWRRGFVARLVAQGIPSDRFFDPVVDDWNEAARAREERAKEDPNLLLFFVGDPKQPGNPLSAFSLVEATLAVCNDPERTVVVLDVDGVEGHARKVLEQTEKLLRAQDPDVPIFRTLHDAERWLAERFALEPPRVSTAPAGR